MYDGEVVDGKGECTECGGWYTVRADGEIRSHKCSGVIEVPNPGKPTSTSTPTKRRTGGSKRSKEIPDAVAKLAIALVASMTEAVTRTVVARAVPMDRDAIPDQITDLPEPEAMIKPFLVLAWPQVPSKAQRVIREIADHSDVIDALFQWQEWLMTMREFVKQARDYRAQIEGHNVVTFQPPSAAAAGSTIAAPGFTPFQPAGESPS